ncbi:hypothetical protein UFOVP434_56 [uncultured Caudovirales phage]|uniref:Portal protein n=1 Tax=uncultured Caudovirales phage TaxID=2100421 RepID=A0A6J5MDD3_9CAUD|nr:hypothetical protein UFOVP434_56 [uncultured Caudovirales phage]
MPELKHLPELPYENLETEPLPAALEQIKNTYALQLVTKTFSNYENYRVTNHDQRFVTQDQLYTGWVAPKVWANTNIPRASIPYNLTFDQIESAHPSISQALFNSGDWFSIEADRGTSPNSLVEIKDHLKWVIEHAKNDFGGSGVNELKLATKDILYRGNGGVFLEWNPAKKRPVISWVDLRDLYVDPGVSVPNLDESRSVIRRKMFTVKELQAYRDSPGMMIPTDDELYTLALNSPFARQDQTIAQQEAVRGVNYYPNSTDVPANPVDRKIECLIYYDSDRIIWVLNRKYVAYNERNPYGFIPFCFAPCYIYPGRWYAMSIPDMQEYNQRYIEALLNARLDRIHLSLEPPRLVKRASLLTPGNNRWHPGKMISVDSKDDYQLLEPQDVIPNVYTEIEFIQNAAERRTGINGFGQGVPSGGNVNRTATGVTAQTSGSSMRLLDIVENIENYLLVPMLYKLFHIISVHTSSYDFLDARSENGEMYKVPASVFSSRVNFTIKASSKMITKERLMQIFPFVTQYLLNGPLLQQLSSAGQTVDSAEILRFLQDAAGTAESYTLIRPMNEQELQQRNQPDPAQLMEKQSKDADNQTRLQIAEMGSQTEIQKAMISKQEDPAIIEIEKQKAENELRQDQIANQLKMQFEREMAQIKIAAEREKNAQQMQAKQLDHQLSAKQTIEKAQVDSVAMRQKMMNDNLAAQNNLQFTDQKNKQTLDFERIRAAQKPRTNESQKPKEPKKKAGDKN